VTLLVTAVLGDAGKRVSNLLVNGGPHSNSQVEVLATDDEGVGHLGRVDNTGQDTATDGDIAGEGALLVDVGAVDGLCGTVRMTTIGTPLSSERRCCCSRWLESRERREMARLHCRNVNEKRILARMRSFTASPCRQLLRPFLLRRTPTTPNVATTSARPTQRNAPVGVLKPRPTSLYQRLVLVATFLPPVFPT
jgi:hypothetical protein